MAASEKERTIAYRVTEGTWSEVEKRAAKAGDSPHQWARSALLETLKRTDELTPGDYLLFEHFVRAQYLFTQGFQLLADGKLTGEEWKKFRAAATQRASQLAQTALANYAERITQNR
jgi:hypothetical protein